MRKIPTKHQFVAIYKHEDEYIVKVPENPAADYYTGGLARCSRHC